MYNKEKHLLQFQVFCFPDGYEHHSLLRLSTVTYLLRKYSSETMEEVIYLLLRLLKTQ